MTLSLSSSVRSSVRTLFFLLVSLKFFLVLKSFNCVSRKFKECWKFQGCLKEVSRMFQGSIRGVYRKFQGYLKGVSRKCQECFKEDSV